MRDELCSPTHGGKENPFSSFLFIIVAEDGKPQENKEEECESQQSLKIPAGLETDPTFEPQLQTLKGSVWRKKGRVFVDKRKTADL